MNLFTSNFTINSAWHEKELAEDVTNYYSLIISFRIREMMPRIFQDVRQDVREAKDNRQGHTLQHPKLCGNCSFPQNLHTRKLGEITVFSQ